MEHSLLQVTIHESDDLLVIELPYNPRMQDLFRASGGKWDSSKRCWNLPAQKENYKLLKTMFNWVPGCGAKWIKVNNSKVRATKPLAEDEGSEVYYKGYLLASRSQRDRRVSTPSGVIAIGTYSARGGSFKYPDVMDGSSVTSWDVLVYDGKSLIKQAELDVARLGEEEVSTSVNNQLSVFTDEELINELQKRGFKVLPSPDACVSDLERPVSSSKL